MPKHQVNFTDIVAAMKETRDGLKPGESARTMLSVDADGDWEFTCHVGRLVEDNGDPDEWGNRSWTLPECVDYYTDQDIETIAQRWVDGEYREYYRFPPIDVVYE